MQIIFHVGISKTGSTSIQLFMHKYAKLLHQHGYWIPQLQESQIDTVSLSGNGYPLCLKIGTIDTKEFLNDPSVTNYIMSCIEEARNNKCKKIILSSESFSSLPRQKWIYLATCLDKIDCRYTFIVIEREPYSWYFSSWLQQVKRCAYTGWIDGAFKSEKDIHFSLYPLLTRNVLEKLFLPKHAVRAINFEDNKKDILGAFLEAIEFRPKEKLHIKLANPAMTANEFFLFYNLNKMSKGNIGLTERVLKKFTPQAKNAKGKFFFCNREIQQIIYNFLDTNEASYQKCSYENIQNISEDDFLAQFSGFSRMVTEFYATTFEYFLDYHDNILSLTNYKARLYSKSQYKDKTPDSFNVIQYLLINKDVLFSDIDPYMHYFLYGQNEGRKVFLTVPS